MAAARSSLRRRMAGVGLLLLAGTVGWAPPAGAQGATTVSYSVREARAYAYRVSLSPEVIEVAQIPQTLQPCDPETDPYQCDDAVYEHTPNCPAAVAVGARGKPPAHDPASGVEATEGGAGDPLGAPEPPPLASPITLNEQLSLGVLSRLGEVVEAGGLATDGYVDLSGRRDPTRHTESDAFTPNRATYEERCAPEDATEDEYAHFLSRSSQTPETYHLAECRDGECTFGGIAIGAEAERAATVVHLREAGGRLHGRLHASLHDAVWGGGALTADLLDTTLEFSTDGTAGGLEYSIATAAVGFTLGGVPVTLAAGQPVALPGIQIGMAAPYVSAPSTGRSLEVVAPGLYIATSSQTVFFGGVELYATMGRQPLTPPGTDGSSGGDGGVIGGGSNIPPIGPGTATPSPASSPVPSATGGPDENEIDPELAVSRVQTGGWVVPLILGAGLMAAALMLVRWFGRYPWGRRLYRVQPFRSIDWVYRAFMKS
ncbi:MAG: hypothetical protein LC722_07460 [Actinobacteria bacterium]|nr:hypothetical protein [Actinomycetota bacterium]